MKIALFLVVLGSLLLASSASAADPLRLEISAVEEKAGSMTVTVSAFDASGTPLTDLTAANFKAALNGSDLMLQSLDAPGGGGKVSTAIVLLVDTSGSMYGEPITQARAALQDFVKNLDPNDQVAILNFSTTVAQLQDFTTNRTQLDAAINKITALGDTALYDAIVQATQKASTAQPARKLVVVLSDGVNSINNDQRDASIEAARAAGVSIVSVGFGSGIDREYLQTIADVTNGRVLEASTTAALRQAYIDLAASIRARYTLNLVVPPSVDRTGDGKLSINLATRSETSTVERVLPPLAGAKVPGFAFSLEGLKPNQKLDAVQTLTPKAPAGIDFARVEYQIDGKTVDTLTVAPFSFNLDPASMAPGAHFVKVKASDVRGATAETDVSFSIPAVAGTSPIARMLPVLLLLLVVGLAGGGGYMFIKKRLQQSDAAAVPQNVERIRPFAVKVNEGMAAPEDWPERPVYVPPVVPELLGRIVVMDEDAIREGDLSKIREFSIGTAPLTLGAGEDADIQIDGEPSIAMEEARLWVQKGRLVYHKLTTLSAMATEGVTSGWLLLASGEEIHLGRYRLLFQAEIPANSYEEPTELELPPQNSQFRGWPA